MAVSAAKQGFFNYIADTPWTMTSSSSQPSRRCLVDDSSYFDMGLVSLGFFVMGCFVVDCLVLNTIVVDYLIVAASLWLHRGWISVGLLRGSPRDCLVVGSFGTFMGSFVMDIFLWFLGVDIGFLVGCVSLFGLGCFVADCLVPGFFVGDKPLLDYLFAASRGVLAVGRLLVVDSFSGVLAACWLCVGFLVIRCLAVDCLVLGCFVVDPLVVNFASWDALSQASPSRAASSWLHRGLPRRGPPRRGLPHRRPPRSELLRRWLLAMGGFVDRFFGWSCIVVDRLLVSCLAFVLGVGVPVDPRSVLASGFFFLRRGLLLRPRPSLWVYWPHPSLSCPRRPHPSVRSLVECSRSEAAAVAPVFLQIFGKHLMYVVC